MHRVLCAEVISGVFEDLKDGIESLQKSERKELVGEVRKVREENTGGKK